MSITPESTQSAGGNTAFVPEKLNLWDRWFNRYRREVIERGEDVWTAFTSLHGIPIESSKRTVYRNWVDYRVIDRLTGSERIEREYLN